MLTDVKDHDILRKLQEDMTKSYKTIAEELEREETVFCTAKDTATPSELGPCLYSAIPFSRRVHAATRLTGCHAHACRLSLHTNHRNRRAVTKKTTVRKKATVTNRAAFSNRAVYGP